MLDRDKSKQELIDELAEIRRQAAALQGIDSERKRAQEALREREARLLEAQEVANLGFYVLDLATGGITTSPILDRIFGIPADYERTLDEWVHLVHPDERQEMLDYLKDVVAEKKPFDREYRIVRHGDNQVRCVHGRGRLRFNENGQPISILGTVQDITERKRADEALQKAKDELEQRVEERTADLAKANEHLRQSHDELQTIYDNMVDGLLIADCATGRLLRTNPAACQVLGYSEEELLSKSIEDIHPTEVASAILEKFRMQREGQKLITESRPTLRKDGTVFYADISNIRISYQGRPCVIGLFRDITERKLVEEALRASEERFRVTFEEAPVGMVIGVGDGVVVKTNRAVCRMTGYTEEELIGQHVRDLTHPEDRELSGPLVKRLMAGEIPSFTLEKRYLRKDGQPFWAQATTAMAHGPDGKIAFALGVVEDITERKRAQEALRQSEERLRLAQQVARVGTFEWKVQAGLSIWTPELEAMYGLPRGGFSGTHSAWENLIHCDDRAKTIRQAEQAFETGEPLEAEWRVVWPDGSVHQLLGRMQAFKDEFGKPQRMIGVSIDITERKQAQAALERERYTLKHMLEASDHERRLIAYDIHDGLAQELAGAIMQFQIYAHARQANPKDAAKAFDSAMTMLQQSHAEARRLISGVRPPILDESGVVAAIVHLVYDPAFGEEPTIDFRNRVTFKRLAPILENVIYRIVQEGLSNARNHSKSKKIRVSLKQRGDRLRIEIRDWGVGFDPKVVPENHFGLEGIRERARLLGGQCSIKSKVGKGTRIMVELPVVPRDEEK